MARKPSGGSRKPKVVVGEDGRPTPVADKAAKVAASTPAKVATVAATQHNTPDLVFLRHFRKCADLKLIVDEAQGVYRSALKAAKSDGVETDDIIAGIQAKKREGADVLAKMTRRVDVLKLLSVFPPGTQLGLFGTPGTPASESSEEQSEWDAESAGYKSGRTGGDISAVPFKPGERNHAAWSKGFQRGMTAIAKEMGPGKKVASGRKSLKPKAEPSAPRASAPAAEAAGTTTIQ